MMEALRAAGGRDSLDGGFRAGSCHAASGVTMEAERHGIEGDTPAMRLISLLEVIASREHLFSPQELAKVTALPGATLHRMLAQLEAAGLLQRCANGRHYDKGARLRRFAESLLLNDTRGGAQRAVLRDLAAQVGESC